VTNRIFGRLDDGKTKVDAERRRAEVRVGKPSGERGAYNVVCILLADEFRG